MNARFQLPPRVPHVPNPRPDWAICNDCEGHGTRCVGFDSRIVTCDACNGEGGYTVCAYCGDEECDCDAADYALAPVERISPTTVVV